MPNASNLSLALVGSRRVEDQQTPIVSDTTEVEPSVSIEFQILFKCLLCIRVIDLEPLKSEIGNWR